MEETDIKIVPSGDFLADPARYLEKVDREPIGIRSSDGQVYVTIGGLVDLNEPDDPEPGTEVR